MLQSALHACLALVLAPLLPGIINRVKAFYAGRQGVPVLQLYYDILKGLRKGVVTSRTTGWVFRTGPLAGLACAGAALLLLPLGSSPALLPFRGDLVLLIGCFGLARFFTVLAALDTGSAFEGMGASREVQFAALAEPALLLTLAALVRLTGETSLSDIYPALGPAAWIAAAPTLVLVCAALCIVFLAENSRIPVDDPNTHLELTMIHEVMVLDHSGPELACIEYAAALKLWILGALAVGVAVPVRTGLDWADAGAAVLGLFLLAVLTGVVESSMARVKMLHVPRFLLGAVLCAVLSLILVLRAS